ncbi:hypothetical protein FSP39_009667 [Pinctada imbricata]|uniref:HAT C-terminal dimerisation domain-containing protein n=1 Tax=Pinctada imbricata TaxID=66713 RepID=A0AA88YNC8_PINIB|nr:hypothetical protein FSP39_009667 [Pinctada imbricata]
MACLLNPSTKDPTFMTEEAKVEVKDRIKREASEVRIQHVSKVKVKVEKSDEQASPPLPSIPELPSDDENNNNQRTTKEISPEVPNSSVKRKLADMEDWLDDVICVGESRLDTTNVIDLEVANYFSTVTDTNENQTLLQWWMQNESVYPHVSILAKKYLAIPASSVPSERVFSLAGILINKKRSRLSPDNVDLFIFLNKNMKDYW